VKALAIDGGGSRADPGARVAEIETRTGRPIATMVDLIAGTSTGGIIACALARTADAGRPGSPRSTRSTGRRSSSAGW
jgi:patatin-like phospholipase/acyl hydrolase